MENIGDPEKQKQKNASFVVKIPSYEEVVESSQPKSQSLFKPSTSFSQAFSFIKNSEFYTSPPSTTAAQPSKDSPSSSQGPHPRQTIQSEVPSTSVSSAGANRNAILVSHRQNRRLDEMEKVTKELQATMGEVQASLDGLGSKLIQLDATHSAQFRTLLARLDRNAAANPQPSSGGFSGTGESSPPPPLPPPPPPPPPTGTFAALPPRMDLPMFDGTDPIAWLAQAEQYFLVHGTAPEQHVPTALIAMSGKAMFWAQWLLRRTANVTWIEFRKELVARFGDSSAINAYEAMHLTRQTGSLEDYLALFEERVAQLPELPAAQYLGIFSGGLQPSIRDSIPDTELSDVFAAIRSARRVARVTRPSTPSSKPISAFPLRSTSTSISSAGNVDSNTNKSNGSLSAVSSEPSAGHSSYGFLGPPPNRNVRHLTPEEAREYRAKVKCYRCGERYGPLHKCVAKHLNVIIDADDDDEGNDFSEPNFEPSCEVQP